jgi:tetratricopeptide (TPR) repeat protein
MTPKQLKQREILLARNDATLDRWPERTGPEFIREMTAVLQGLEALAREADAVVGDRLERCRTWRYVGNAYFDLGAVRELAQLKHAADAYQRAEALLEGLDDPIERMKLDYSYGNALFHLCDAQDLQLAQEARRRYSSALAIARIHMPAGVEAAQSALTNAEMVVALLQTASVYRIELPNSKKIWANPIPPRLQPSRKTSTGWANSKNCVMFTTNM